MKPIVVITGSEGLIGSKLVRNLHSDYHVVGFDRDHTHANEGMRDLIFCDLSAADSVTQAVDCLERDHGSRLASVVHLAAYYDFSGSDSPMYRSLTVEGTERLMRAIRRFTVEQFVFSSTILVMRPSEDGQRIDETSPIQAEWAYPRSKLQAERAIAREHAGIPAVILRIGGVYDDVGRAVPIVQQMRRIYEKQLESFFFPGDDDHGQAMVHIDDLADAVRRTIERRPDLGAFEPFLIGEPEVVPYRELQDRLGHLIHGRQWPSIRIPESLAKAGARVKNALSRDGASFVKPWMIDLADQDYRIDISKAKRELGWVPERNLRDTLPSMVGTLLDDPEGWYRQNGLEAVSAR